MSPVGDRSSTYICGAAGRVSCMSLEKSARILFNNRWQSVWQRPYGMHMSTITCPTRLPSTAEMQRAFDAKDATYDGVFFVAVRTTGIFCKPSCSARPLAKNCEFFATAGDALFAGYRPCKRCRPLEAAGGHPAWVESLLADLAANPATRITDGDLRRRGLVPATVRRYFLSKFGVTFQGFCRARRLGGALERIRTGESIDGVATGNGYDSFSGFRSAFGQFFGDSPGRSRSADFVRLAWIETPLGPLVGGATSAGVCLVEFTNRRMLEAQLRTIQRRFAMPLAPGDNQHLTKLRRELDSYFAGKLKSFTVPVVTPGTPFQERVWQGLREIPYGETCSYDRLAAAVGRPGAARAVGRANGQNRVSILVPCHRVIMKDGRLCGYGGGLWRKRRLLDLETAAAD
jgi:AraC family transcriptional regulator of adaptative response/methylated-DNA-[protein]-cysteine methyltransferase